MNYWRFLVTSLAFAPMLATNPVLASTGQSSVTIDEAGQASAPQAVSESMALASSIVSIIFPPDHREAMMDKLMNTILSQMKAGMALDTITDPGLRQILFDYIDSVPQRLRPATVAFIPKQLEAMAQAYTRMFSLDELKDIAAFAQTPSGRNYLQQSTNILSDPGIAAVNTAYFRETQELSRQGQAELKQKMVAYILAHPEAIPKAPVAKNR